MISVLIFGCLWWSSKNPDYRETGYTEMYYIRPLLILQSAVFVASSGRRADATLAHIDFEIKTFSLYWIYVYGLWLRRHLMFTLCTLSCIWSIIIVFMITIITKISGKTHTSHIYQIILQCLRFISRTSSWVSVEFWKTWESKRETTCLIQAFRL